MNKARRVAIVLAALGLALGGALGYVLRGSANSAAVQDAGWDEMNRLVFAASVIVLPNVEGKRTTQAREAAVRVYTELTEGGDFAAIARKASQDPTYVDGGFKGFVNIDQDSMFSGAVQALKPGQISFPISTSEGYQIVLRHSYAEACRLEEQYSIPTYGVFVAWSGLPGGLEGITQEDARTLATQLVADLKAGKTTMGEAAARYTPPDRRHPSAFLGLLPNRPDSAQAFAALSEAKEGDVIGPIAESYGYAVLMRGRHLRALVRHILIQHVLSKGRDIRTNRTRDEALKLAKDLLAEVRAKRDNWDSAVERYSDDKKTLMNSGSLGVAHAAGLPPALRDALYQMKPDTIYPEPVETDEGFHILWRVN